MVINLVVSCSSTNQEGKLKGFYNTYTSLATFFHLKQTDTIYISHPQVGSLNL